MQSSHQSVQSSQQSVQSSQQSVQSMKQNKQITNCTNNSRSRHTSGTDCDYINWNLIISIISNEVIQNKQTKKITG